MELIKMVLLNINKIKIHKKMYGSCIIKINAKIKKWKPKYSYSLIENLRFAVSTLKSKTYEVNVVSINIQVPYILINKYNLQVLYVIE